MGHKVFVSYKYRDIDVKDIFPLTDCTARDYVDVLENRLGKYNVYKGEKDGEDLSTLSENTIWERLKNRIYDSSVTIVLISKGMRERGRYDCSQWIPWEVRYSLCEYSKDEITSHTNGLIYVVLPDRNGCYNYFVEHKTCCTQECDLIKTDVFFSIMKGNLFNKKENHLHSCDFYDKLYSKSDSYAIVVKWDEFIDNDLTIQKYIESAYQRSLHKSEFNLCTKINRT